MPNDSQYMRSSARVGPTHWAMPKAARLPLLLVADDSPDDLHLFQQLLKKAGVKNPVATVEDGRQAISFLRASCLAGGSPRGRKPAVIFLDVNMPNAGGFEVLQWIRRKKAFLKSKVIMMTTSDEPRDIQRASELGADGYLLKYPNPGSIAFVIRDATQPGPRRQPG